eukprot:9096199-Pyramimonas_sp.AAC.1
MKSPKLLMPRIAQRLGTSPGSFFNAQEPWASDWSWHPNYNNNGSRLILPHSVFNVALSRGTSLQFMKESRSCAGIPRHLFMRRAPGTQEFRCRSALGFCGINLES